MMKRATKFTISPSWKVLLSDMHLDIAEVLAHAKLPADLFSRAQASVTSEEYFRFCHGLEQAAGEREFPLLLAKHLSVESFDAPFFAAICSPDLNTALARIQQYKPLVGPMHMQIDNNQYATTLTISCYGYTGELPKCLSLSEVVFFTQLARLASRCEIKPLAVILPHLPQNIAQYQDYFGCKMSCGKEVQITFSSQDATRPFITSNAPMWEFFEANLNQKLIDLDTQASTIERVKAVLLESLPAGNVTIDFVAQKLAMTKRTLQRKLTVEAETFQSVLQQVRAELADHYLQKSHMSLSEISFLLGFREANSFIRAFTSWRGISPGNFRTQYQ